MGQMISINEGKELNVVSDGVRLVWDSTTVRNYMKCPKFFWFHDILGFGTQPTRKPALIFGKMFHKMVEIYHLQGEEAGWVYLDDDERKNELAHVTEISRSVASLHEMYKKFIHDESTSRMKTAVYDTIGGNKKMIEFRVLISLTNNKLFGGYLDRVIQSGNQLIPLDYKTTGKNIDYALPSFENDLAIDMYINAIRGMGLNFDSKEFRFIFQLYQLPTARSFVVKSKTEIVERDEARLDIVSAEVLKLVAQQEQYAEKENYPMNQSACWSCSFSSTCSLRLTEQKKLLDSHKASGEGSIWNPLDERN